MILVANAVFDPETGYLRAERPVTLSPNMRRILAALAKQPGQPVSHDRLMTAVWDGRDDGPDNRSLRVSIFRLRERLRDAGVEAAIVSHFAGGYSLRPFDSAGDKIVTLSPERQAILDTILGRAAAYWPELVREFDAAR